MNIHSLIARHPLLHADLCDLGLSHIQVHHVAKEICCQLVGTSEFNMCYVLSALNCTDFVKALDATQIAGYAGIHPSVAQSAVMTIAPWVDRFRLQAV